MALDENSFGAFADLRKHVEAAYWHEAVKKLTADDQSRLRSLMERAWSKLNGSPVQILTMNTSNYISPSMDG